MDAVLNFTATTGTTYTSYQDLPIEKTGQQWAHPQNLRISAVATTVSDPSALTNTIRLAIFNAADGLIKGYWDATIDWTAELNGGAGKYMGNVAFSESGTSFFDLMGAPGGGTGAGTPGSKGQGDKWIIGITDAFTGPPVITNIALHIAFAGWPHAV